ncbi:MAG TPA: hypothetical protein VH796_08855 [Nitrososphaeraceae archaeon]|jgi:hypothetical protein
MRCRGFASLVSFISISIIPVCFIVVYTFPLPIYNRAFADGLSQEQISASMGSRKADLLIKTIPTVVTTETIQASKQKPTIEFRLFDSNTNKSFSHVNYFITIDKNGKVLLSDWFHSHNGDLGLQVDPVNTSKVELIGEHEPLVGGYLGSLDKPVIAEGPIFVNGGLYHFTVRVGTVDCDTCILPAEQQHLYDSSLSIGSVLNRQVTLNDRQVPVKVISYYDKLKNFTFDNKTMQMQFTMPFNWNLKRINSTNMFVHQEVYVPKSNAFTSNGSFTGKVNGIDVTKQIVVDNSNPGRDIIHVMLPKDNVLKIADQVNRNERMVNDSAGPIMSFELQPGQMSHATTSGNMSMSMGSMGSMGSMSTGSSSK